MKLVALVVGTASGDGIENDKYEFFVISDCLQRGEAPFSVLRMYKGQPFVKASEAGMDWFECASKLIVDEGCPLTFEEQEWVREAVEFGLDVEYRNLRVEKSGAADAGPPWTYRIPDPVWARNGIAALAHIEDAKSRDWALDMLKQDGMVTWWNAEADVYMYGVSRDNPSGSLKTGTMLVKWSDGTMGWRSHTIRYIQSYVDVGALGYLTPRTGSGLLTNPGRSANL